MRYQNNINKAGSHFRSQMLSMRSRVFCSLIELALQPADL